DIFIGFYNPSIMAAVYLSFLLSGLLGLWIKKNKTAGRVVSAAIFASVQFYLITNFAVWAFGTMYPHTLAGLLASYANAIPFFRNTLAGDLFYTGAMFSLYEMVLLGRTKLAAASAIIPKSRL
ncbi:hypothetical protein D4R52_02475, partial [bacterium]